VLLVLACSAPEPVAPPEIGLLLAQDVARFRPENSVFSAAVFSLTRDTLVFGYDETLALIPASGQKLLITALAMERWDEPLVRELEAKLRRSKKKPHKALFEPTRAESLHPDLRRDSSGRYLLNWVNRQSDNFLADSLLALLARRARQDSTALVADWLDARAIARPGLVVADGSGLSGRNRVASLTIAGVLRETYHSEHRERFAGTLARPGADGTLARRGLGLGSRVRAKTGFIRSVFSVCGYVSCPSDTYAFAFVQNGSNSGRSSYRLFTRLLLTLYHHSR